MSYDLAVWYPHRSFSNREAGKAYSTISKSSPLLMPHQSVTDFYLELTKLHPEIDDISEDNIDDLELCPWSARHDATDKYVVMHFVFSQAEAISKVISKLAEKHALALYDPQQNKIYYPSSVNDREISLRSIGIVLLMCGSGLGFICIYSPYAAIIAGKHGQAIYMLPIIFAPVAFGLGLPYAVLGDRAKWVLGHPHQPNAAQGVLVVALMALGWLIYAWLKGL